MNNTISFVNDDGWIKKKKGFEVYFFHPFFIFDRTNNIIHIRDRQISDFQPYI